MLTSLLLCFFIFSPVLFPIVTATDVQLLIDQYPASIMEGETFQIRVTDGKNPVGNVNVEATYGTYRSSSVTNSLGAAELTAPWVDTTATLTIRASKLGQAETTYLPAIVTVEVLNSPDQLSISAPPSVLEGAVFTVTVTVYTDPLEGAIVEFFNIPYSTNATGEVELIAPLVDHDTNTVITASKIGFDADQVSMIILDSPAPEPSLTLDSPESVGEGTVFLVTVFANDLPLGGVFVTFNNQSNMTNSIGRTQMTAPFVAQTATYTLTAQKEGYQPTSREIIVLNLQRIQASIYGRVADSQQKSIEGVQICATDVYNVETCMQTDDQGNYQFDVLPGTYTVSARKEGYSTSIVYDIRLIDNAAQELNFILEEFKEEPRPSNTFEPIDYAITWGIQEGIIGAAVSITPKKLVESTIYNTSLSLNVSSVSDNRVTVTISGPEGPQGTIVVIRIQNITNVFNISVLNLSKIVVTFDEVTIPIAPTLGVIFNSSNSSINPEWAAVVTGEDVYIIVSVPHFSEHVITVSIPKEVTKIISNIMTIALYFSVIIIFTLFYVIPIRLAKKYR